MLDLMLIVMAIFIIAEPAEFFLGSAKRAMHAGTADGLLWLACMYYTQGWLHCPSCGRRDQGNKYLRWRAGWPCSPRGLPLRIVMIGTLTGLQWGIYDAFKVYVGL